MFPREQQRPGTMGRPAGAANVGIRPDVFLPGQHADATTIAQLLPGQLLQRVRHVDFAHGHQPDCRILGPGPIA